MSTLSIVDAKLSASERTDSAERSEATLALRSGSQLTVAGILLAAASIVLNQLGPVAERFDVPVALWVLMGVAFAGESYFAVQVHRERHGGLETMPLHVLDRILWGSTWAMATCLAIGLALVPAAQTMLSVLYMMLVVYAGFFYRRTYALTAIAWCVIAYVTAVVLAADGAGAPNLATAVPVVGVMVMSGTFVAIARRRREQVEQRARIIATVGLAHALDLRDPNTAEHSDTVAQYAVAMARELGLSDHRIERVRLAAVVHDVGKIGIPDAVLFKPGKLTDEEWDLMRRHPEMGAQMLDSRALRDIRSWVLCHHERPDGRGYPAGLAGDEIPLEARILAVADSFEAMTSDRVYRPGMPIADALEELRRCSGSQFDPVVVEAFLATSAGAVSGASALAA